MPKISALPIDAAPTLTDYIATLDSETSTTKRATLQAIINALSPAWTSYVGAMKANGGTAPTYTATDVGKYAVVGKFCYVQFYKTNSAGGTAGAGSVQLEYTLPVAANTSTTAANTVPCGTGNLLNGAGSGLFTIHITNSTGVVFKATSVSNFQNVDQNNATRQLYGSFVYEIA